VNNISKRFHLGERLNLPNMLRIEHPENDDTWCALDVCDGWAKKRGFITAKAARLDSYRAANDLLRMALDGKICLCLRPPSYLAKKGKSPAFDKQKCFDKAPSAPSITIF
jgi:hypothetical protein